MQPVPVARRFKSPRKSWPSPAAAWDGTPQVTPSPQLGMGVIDWRRFSKALEQPEKHWYILESEGQIDPKASALAASGITGQGRAGSLTVRWVSASNDYLRTGANRARALASILEALAAGRFDARIAGRFELERAAEAHERLASRGILGKLLLRA
jgi:NADPH:quinone reductase-like Zn-dependent oxidoreductase